MLFRTKKKKGEKKNSIYVIVMCMSQIADVKMQERARDRERKRKTERERERETDRQTDFVQCCERVTICIT